MKKKPPFSTRLLASSFLVAATQDVMALYLHASRAEFFLFSHYGLGWVFLAMTAVTLVLDVGAGMLLGRRRLGAWAGVGALLMTAALRVWAAGLVTRDAASFAAAVAAAGLPAKPFAPNVLQAMALTVTLGAAIGMVLVLRLSRPDAVAPSTVKAA